MKSLISLVTSALSVLYTPSSMTSDSLAPTSSAHTATDSHELERPRGNASSTGNDGPETALAREQQHCDEKVSAQMRVDQGHRWRPPFGLERVGSSAIVHVAMTASRLPAQEYFMVAFRDGQETERRKLRFQRNPRNYSHPSAVDGATFFSHTALISDPSHVALYTRCNGQDTELIRESVTWPDIEADAVARPDHRINPVDLGTVLVPHDWLLLANGQSAVVQVAAFSRTRSLPKAKVRAGFTGSKPVEVDIPLVQNQRAVAELKLPLSGKHERATLHVSLIDDSRELWTKNIHAMIVRRRPRWPTFGAVETKLRYDAPIAAIDPSTGHALASIDYNTAWDRRLKDVVVFLPNGSRFVFWRGSSYIPFWAGTYNTGVNYQWTETSVPLADRDTNAKDFLLEPLFDKELRYGRVRIIENSASRVHVRWTYQLPDYRYRVWGDHAAEDFYFYPDGFGTRMVTATSALGAAQQVSEFIILTPQAAYPLEVLPRRVVDVIALDGGKDSISFPVERSKEFGGEQVAGSPTWPAVQRWSPTIYRIFSHKDDPSSAIYFHPRDISTLVLFPPFYDEGQAVTPVYWSNHWPLSRGGWTGWTINNGIIASPGHNSVAWPLDAPFTGYAPQQDVFESVGQSQVLDALGRPREMTTRRWVWMIAMTSLSDAALIEWAKSFAAPPTLELTGARLDFPSYSAERRAMRLVGEQPAIEIKVMPQKRTVNPVFEIDQVPKRLLSITVNGATLPMDSYTWDTKVLWIKAAIDSKGAVIALRFG